MRKRSWASWWRAGLPLRVQALHTAILRHEGKRADLGRDVIAEEKAANDLMAATLKRDRLRADQQKWNEVWPSAIKALGFSSTISPVEANKLATEWIRAEGILEAIAQTKHRLERMDQDETGLKNDVVRAATISSDRALAADQAPASRPERGHGL
jgi:hypothetical protein